VFRHLTAAAAAVVIGVVAVLTVPLGLDPLASSSSSDVPNDGGAPAGDDQLSPSGDAGPRLRSAAELTPDQLLERMDRIEADLVALDQQISQHELTIADARRNVEALEQEMELVSEVTVDNAVNRFRNAESGSSALTSDLNRSLRVSALTDAALVADASVFSDFADKAAELDGARRQLQAAEAEGRRLAEEYRILNDQLVADQAWMARTEERALQLQSRDSWSEEVIWAQQLGTRQGAYLRTCPVKGAHDFIDSWGFPRSGGRRHKGVDIMARIGTPIVAPVNGTVEYRSNRVGGRSFHLFDEKGNYFYGTHLSAYGDVQGEVLAGQIIGYVGDDGNAAGIPHLHFEIHPGGRGNPINPYADSAAVCDGAL
jgi:murein DD-endopeptidase MepM/ murein hydrolase activator NlpD